MLPAGIYGAFSLLLVTVALLSMHTLCATQVLQSLETELKLL